MSDLLFSMTNHLGFISLNRPESLNALSLAMIQSIQLQLEQWEKDDNIHAVVLQAVPGKAFCAGGDVRWLYDMGKQQDPRQLQFFWHEYRLNSYLHHYKKPIICLMNGITMGGGVGISLHCSHPVATEKFIFAMPETTIGFFPDIGASHLLAACPQPIGRYLALMGTRLNAEQSIAAGLVKHQMHSENIPEFLQALQKRDLSNHAEEQVTELLVSLNQASSSFFANLKPIESCFTARSVEDIIISLQEEGSEWSLTQINELAKKSPLSLKVTFAQIDKAQHASLEECLRTDYRLVRHFMKDNDFYEGVRALLVDKDRNPKWQPSSLAAVSAGKVADYFECEDEDLKFL